MQPNDQATAIEFLQGLMEPIRLFFEAHPGDVAAEEYSQLFLEAKRAASGFSWALNIARRNATPGAPDFTAADVARFEEEAARQGSAMLRKALGTGEAGA